MKKDLKTNLINRKIKKPNQFFMTVGMWIVGMMNRHYKVDFSYDYDPKSIKDQPAVLLSSHASRLEFLYTVYGFGRKDINVVCGFQNIFKKGLYRLFIAFGAISKYLYQPDIMCVKNMLRALKRGGAVGLFPEGIQSTSGSTHPINPATARFIKSCKATVVVCTTKGAYLATNRYSKDRKKGYIGVHYTHLFTPQTLAELTEEEIYKQMLAAISYNDFAFNKVARHKYVGKEPNAAGLDKILYKCPDCQKENLLQVEGEVIQCAHCGFAAKVNEYYDLVLQKGNALPSDIDAWFKWQRRCVAEEIGSDSFALTMSGSLCMLKFDKLRKPPKDRELLSVGRATLTNQGLTFVGELDGKAVNFSFEAKALYSLTFSTKGFLEFYYNNDYFMIIPEEGTRGLLKWTLAAEEIHNLYDERWRAACEDVYDYEKGEKIHG